MGQCGGGPGRGCAHDGSIMSQPRNLKLRKPQAFQGAAGKPGQPLPHKQTLSLLFWSGNRSASALEGDYPPKAVCSINIFEKCLGTMNFSCSGWKCRTPWRIVLQVLGGYCVGKLASERQQKAIIIIVKAQSVQFSCSVVSDSATPWIVALQPSLFITNSWSLLSYTAVAFYLLQALVTALFLGS